MRRFLIARTRQGLRARGTRRIRDVALSAVSTDEFYTGCVLHNRAKSSKIGDAVQKYGCSRKSRRLKVLNDESSGIKVQIARAMGRIRSAQRFFETNDEQIRGIVSLHGDLSVKDR